MSSPIMNVVLVRGGFVDGSGWQKVHALLTADGFRVTVVQNPTLSLDDDVAEPEAEAQFMAASQVPWGANALGGAVTRPAWREKPSWYVSQSRATADVIKQAAARA